MKAYLINPATNDQLRPKEPPTPGQSVADFVRMAGLENFGGARMMWLPRIKCNDCPGKVYTTVEGSVVEGFEVHLKNRTHRARVDERKAGRG